MKFAYTRLITDDVGNLAAFYEWLLGMPTQGDDQYVELRPGGAILTLVSRKATAFMHGGSWEAAANRSAILEFSVEDVDAERERLEGFCDRLDPRAQGYGVGQPVDAVPRSRRQRH